jgi:hypothetical protein
MQNRERGALATWCAVLLGCAITLAIRGYQFGQSNHTVYLLSALRLNDPRLLANDWFTTRTLQYHAVFARLSAALHRLGVIRAVFLIGYLALVALWHLAWLRLALALGGTLRVYLLSVIFFFLSAAGLGLGVYDFLQDSALLPSNIANVAMLWGICFWITRRPAFAGAALGLAGFFHLNHALVAIGLWGALVLWDQLADHPEPSEEPASLTGLGRSLRQAQGRPFAVLRMTSLLAGTASVLILSAVSIVPALRALTSVSGELPLREFVDLYVRLRHPHHYDPSSWPVALWLTFLWPIPFWIAAARRAPAAAAKREAARVFLLLFSLQLLALSFAGVWYVSETLIQLSLYRFSIYVKLLSCIGAALMLGCNPRRPLLFWAALSAAVLAVVARLTLTGIAGDLNPLPLLAALLLCCAAFDRTAAPVVLAALIAIAAGATLMAKISNAHLLGVGVLMNPQDSADYHRLCIYARDRTPIDAIFLVPPSEQEFRLIARRAIVVNFKGVPQLSAELPEWRDRLARVLDLPPTLDALPRERFDHTLAAIAKRYGELPADHLRAVAREYHARYVVAARPLDLGGAALVFESGPYHLYDLTPQRP